MARTARRSETNDRVYEFIVDYFTTNGYAPSVREIRDGVGLKSTSTVFSHLFTLERMGKIHMDGNKPRAIRVIGYSFVKDVEEKKEEKDEHKGASPVIKEG